MEEAPKKAEKKSKGRPKMESVENEISVECAEIKEVQEECVIANVAMEEPVKQEPKVEEKVEKKPKEKVKPIKKRKGKVVLIGKATISVQDERGVRTTLKGHHDAKLGDIVEY